MQKDETEIGDLVIRRHLMHTFGDPRDFVAKCDKWFEDKHAELGITLGSPPWIAYIKQLTEKDMQRGPGSPHEDAEPGSSGSANNELTAGGIAEPASVLPLMEYNP